MAEDPIAPTDQAEPSSDDLLDASVAGGVWPPRDRAGAKLPVRFNALHMLGAVPSIIGAFKTHVPDEYWTRDAAEDEYPIAVIACPCGEQPAVRLAGTRTCNCGRAFLFTGTEVRVAFSPAPNS